MPTTFEYFRRIGGPTLLDRKLIFNLGIPISLASALLFRQTPEVLTFEILFRELFVFLMIWLFILLNGELARATIFRKHRENPIPAPLVVGFGAALGVCALVFMSWLEGLIGLIPIGLSGAALFVAGLLGAILITLSSVFEIARREFRFNESVRLSHSLAASITNEPTEQIASFFRDLEVRVVRVFERSQHDSPAQVLERVLVECVKPMSRSRWIRPNWIRDLLVIRGINVDAIALRPFSAPTIVAALYAGLLFAFNAISPDVSVTSSAIAALISFLVITAVFTLANLTFKKSRTFLINRFFGAYAGVVVITACLITLSNQLLFVGEIDPGRYLAGSTANFIALGIASVVFSASWKGGRLAGEGPRVRRKDRDVSGSLALAHRELVSRKLASFLHSSVQNRILALQLSQPQEPPESIHSLESAVIDIIDQAKHDFLVSQSLPISERLKRLQADWEGVARLEFSLPESDLTTSQAEVVVMLAEEAITNSIRHGLATEVSVAVSPGDFPNQIIFEVLDNGTGPLGKTKVGLGSSLLRELANDEWSLGFRDIGGARLFAKVIC